MKRIGLFSLVVVALLGIGLSVHAQTVQNVEVHGFMLNRFYANPDASARFVTERISTIVQAKVGEDGQAYFEVYWHPWITDSVVAGGTLTAEWARTYVESAYVDLPLGGNRIRVGKGRQLNFGMTPTYGNRKTTQYGIISETFTQDRIQGIQYYAKKNSFDGGITLFSDQGVDTRSIGDFAGVAADRVVKHLVDKDLPGRISGRLALAGKVGINKPRFQAHVSACTGGLSPSQLGAVNTAFGYTPDTPNTDHNKFGLDAIYNSGPFVAQAEWYTGKFSYVGIDGYSVMVGYQPKDSRRFYVRYAALNNDRAPTTNSATWNTQQFTLGIVQPIRKGVWAELNWERNMESPPTGVANVKNDLLFVELFTGF